MRFYTMMVGAFMAMTAMAQETNDTTYVMMDFTQNPWNYPVTEVTKGWSPDFADWDSPGAILTDKDFSWSIGNGSTEKVKVTVYSVDLDEFEKVPVYGRVDPTNAAEAAALGVPNAKMNVLYTTSGTTMRFESPAGYKFGKMVFYCFHSPNFMVGDEYEEEFEYEYDQTIFKQKLKVWTPSSPKVNPYSLNTWEGDETNILFNYPYFNAHFVRIDIRLVPEGASAIREMTAPKADKRIFDLQGRLQESALRKGIYVSEGRKIVK